MPAPIPMKTATECGAVNTEVATGTGARVMRSLDGSTASYLQGTLCSMPISRMNSGLRLTGICN